MKSEKPGLVESITAAAALVAHRFIGMDGNYCGAGLKALGVSALATAINEQCPVDINGIRLVESGGAVTVTTNPVPVKSDSIGRAVAAVTFAAAAPVVDISKLTIGATALTVDSGATPVTSAAANGDIITATAGAMDAASGLLAAPVLTGSIMPEAINGYQLDSSGDAGEFVRVRIA